MKLLWSRLTDLPVATQSHGVAIIGTKIYIFGGFTSTGVTKKCYEYDIPTGIWTEKASLNTARYVLGSGAVNGKAYAVGGYTGSAYLKTVEEYDPVANTWTLVSSMGTARANCGTAVSGNKLYAVGGYDGGPSYLSSAEVYDPSTDIWTPITSLPAPARSGLHGACTVNPATGKLYVTGGNSTPGNALQDVEEYDPSTNTWTSLSDLPTPGRHDAICIVQSNYLFVIGGQGASIPPASILADIDFMKLPSGSWQSAQDFEEGLYVAGAVSYQGGIYIPGGRRTLPTGPSNHFHVGKVVVGYSGDVHIDQLKYQHVERMEI